MNRALKVGRVAPLIVDILNRIEHSQLAEHFRIVGTHALYAYESSEGMIFDDVAVATRDMDFLWDVRKRVSFAMTLRRIDSSMLGVLRKLDATFRVRNSQKYTAVNKDGFEVDIIRREQVNDDYLHPVSLSDDDDDDEDPDDFWVTQAPRAQGLPDSSLFSAVIVATNGDMARMDTLEPMALVRFKEWMSAFPERDPLKRRPDALQAEAVSELVKAYLPHLDK